MTDTPATELVKILLLGNSSVGKTCMFLKYSEDSFNVAHLSTIGMDYCISEIVMEDGVKKTFQIWDTAGQDRFRGIVKNYIKGAHGVLLVYDITSEESYEGLEHWLEHIKDNASLYIKIVIIGNKCDLSDRKVPQEKVAQKAKEMGYEFFETSAKTGHNITEAFNYICKIAYDEFKKLQDTQQNDKKIKLNNSKKKEKGNCCK